jgi:hypothetical protein
MLGEIPSQIQLKLLTSEVKTMFEVIKLMLILIISLMISTLLVYYLWGLALVPLGVKPIDSMTQSAALVTLFHLFFFSKKS